MLIIILFGDTAIFLIIFAAGDFLILPSSLKLNTPVIRLIDNEINVTTFDVSPRDDQLVKCKILLRPGMHYLIENYQPGKFKSVSHDFIIMKGDGIDAVF